MGPERYVGVFMFCDFDNVAYVYICMDVDSIFVVVFADVGPRGREVEMVGESAPGAETAVGRGIGRRVMQEG
jgi:hypothetical protein